MSLIEIVEARVGDFVRWITGKSQPALLNKYGSVVFDVRPVLDEWKDLPFSGLSVWTVPEGFWRVYVSVDFPVDCVVSVDGRNFAIDFSNQSNGKVFPLSSFEFCTIGVDIYEVYCTHPEGWLLMGGQRVTCNCDFVVLFRRVG